MKLEYLADGSPDCPLVRLYDFDRDEIGKLLLALRDLSSRTVQQVSLHQQPFIESIGACELNLVSATQDHDIVQIQTSRFDFKRSQSGWDDLIRLIEPFSAVANNSFQWLSRKNGISLLLSCDGLW
jgi:hypothetical protein